MKRTEKKSEEPKVRATMNVPDVKSEVKETKKAKAPAKAPLKTTASDLSTVGTNIVSLVADYGAAPAHGAAPTPRSPVVAKQLKDANRALNRMKGQKQGT